MASALFSNPWVGLALSLANKLQSDFHQYQHTHGLKSLCHLFPHKSFSNADNANTKFGVVAMCQARKGVHPFDTWLILTL